MKTQVTMIVICLSLWANAQVGINNTDPKANLDISASNTATPTNTDGILIPRIDEFPLAAPTAAQNGMMIFATGVGAPTKGFYYWDNSISNWVSVNGSGDADWFKENTTTAPNNIIDDIFTQGNVAIGKNTADYSLDIESIGDRGINTLVSGTTTGKIYGHYNENSNTGNGFHYGVFNFLTGAGIGAQFGTYQDISNNGDGTHYASYNLLKGRGEGPQYGSRQVIENTGDGDHFGVSNVLLGTGDGDYYGTLNSIVSGGNGKHYGSHNNLRVSGTGHKYGVYSFLENSFGGVGGSGNLYGIYTYITTDTEGTRTHYGVYSDSQLATGYAGYFIGRMSLGNTTSNRYLMPATDGTANFIMQTNGSGQVSFVDPATIGDGTGNDWTTTGNAGTNSNANFIGTTDPRALVFKTNNIERARLKKNGEFQIKKNSTASHSQIKLIETTANDGARIKFTNAVETNNSWLIFGRADNTAAQSRFNIAHDDTNILHIRGDGRVGINDNNPTFALELPNNATNSVGQARANAWIIYSDGRIKKNQRTIKYGLKDLLKIQPKSYLQFSSNFDTNKLTLVPNSGTEEIGFIAQELYEIIPEAAFKPKNENNDLWSVDYEKIIPVAVQAIKELNTKIETLEKENQKLKQKLSALETIEARLTALENKNTFIFSATNSEKQ